MTPNEAIAAVKSRAEGRTRYDGQEPFLDEVLVGEIERLRRKLKETRDAFRYQEHIHSPSKWNNEKYEEWCKQWDAETERMVMGTEGCSFAW